MNFFPEQENARRTRIKDCNDIQFIANEDDADANGFILKKTVAVELEITYATNPHGFVRNWIEFIGAL